LASLIKLEFNFAKTETDLEAFEKKPQTWLVLGKNSEEEYLKVFLANKYDTDEIQN